MTGLWIFLVVTMCAITVGFVIAGVSCFVIEWYFKTKRDYISDLLGAAGKALENYGGRLESLVKKGKGNE